MLCLLSVILVYIMCIKQTEEYAMKEMGRPKSKYEFYDPKGNLVVVHGLKELCDEHDLNISRMSAVYRGKAKHHKGWKTAINDENIVSENKAMIEVPIGFTVWLTHISRARGMTEEQLINEVIRDARIKERKRKAALD